MRWRFLDLQSPADAAFQRQMLARIDAWWGEFSANTDRLSPLFNQQEQWDLPAWMHEHLGDVDGRLCWEYGPAVRGEGHRLVITPESHRELRPLTASIIERAPKLPGWEFYPYRLPESAEMAQMTVEARTQGDLTGVEVQAAVGEHRLIDLRFLAPGTSGADDDQSLQNALVAAETLLGEENLDHHIGLIEVDRLKSGLFRRKPSTIPLDRLYGTVGSLIEASRDQLPDQPHHAWATAENVTWSALKLEPEEADDYPRFADQFTAITPVQELWIATRCGRPFCSGRFSRCSELFCCLKIDGADGLEGSEFEDREAIENAVNHALVSPRLGCSLGGGTGLRYSYVELALSKPDEAIAALRRRMQTGKLPRRSWVLFHDTDLCGEWVGICDDTPPPPGRE
jgi:hypothetical protein